MTTYEKRRATRWNLINNLRIFDGESFVGYLVDINEGGMGVVSERPIVEDDGYQLAIEIVMERVVVRARSVWTRKVEGAKKMYQTGFRFQDLKPEAVNAVRCLTECLKHGRGSMDETTGDDG